MNIKEETRNFLASYPYSETTKRTYSDILPRVLDRYDGDVEKLSAADLLDLISANGWGNPRKCLALAATQKFLKWKYGNTHPALSAKIKRIKGKPQRSLDKDTALALLASFNPYSATGARNLAMASLALDTGLRASELCRLEIKHLNLEARVLQVLVKGGKWRSAVFSGETAIHIQRWLHYRKEAKNQEQLFTSTFTGEALTPEGLGNIIKSWGEKIGIKLSPHDLRRSFAVLATEAGAPERILMEGGGWETSEMIITYTRNLRLETMRKYLPVDQLGN